MQRYKETMVTMTDEGNGINSNMNEMAMKREATGSLVQNLKLLGMRARNCRRLGSRI